MAEKSIVFFTIGYPYGKGDEFLEAEMKCAELYFDKVLIVSCNKEPDTVSQYVPRNAKLISLRGDISSLELLFIRISCLFSYQTWRQVLIGIKQNGFAEATNCIYATIADQSLIKLLRRKEDNWLGKYDFYYSYWLTGAATYLALRKRKTDGLVFSRTHGYDCFSYRGFHPYRKEQLNNLDYIFPISNAGKEDLIKQGCDENKIIVSRLGVEKPDSTMNPFVPSETKTIVTCSNIVDLKRLDLLIDALDMIDDININWVHFGDGVQKEEIQQMAVQKLSKKKNIQYSFRGRVLPAEVLNYYSSVSIDCFINCSDVEGIPVSIMEAMSYGIPCIARDVGGNREIVTNNNGLLIPGDGSAEKLREAIIKILTMSIDDYEVLRKSAFETYLQRFDAKKNYRTFYEHLNDYYVLHKLRG